PIPSKCDRVAVLPGDILYFSTWGGGGWGDPLQRDPALVLADVERGLVTINGAKRYGVVIKNGAVNGEATAKLRNDIAAKRGKIQMFDRGFGSIEELKRRCKAETAFDAPVNPTSERVMQVSG
ncbi:MAG: hypothetical protein ACYCZU_11285, partial [Devosia sp.]